MNRKIILLFPLMLGCAGEIASNEAEVPSALSGKSSISYSGSIEYRIGKAVKPAKPTLSGTGVVTCTIAPSTASTPPLAPGLSLDPSTCILSGTPTVYRPSSVYKVTAKFSNGAAVVSTASANITVAPSTNLAAIWSALQDTNNAAIDSAAFLAFLNDMLRLKSVTTEADYLATAPILSPSEQAVVDFITTDPQYMNAPYPAGIYPTTPSDFALFYVANNRAQVSPGAALAAKSAAQRLSTRKTTSSGLTDLEMLVIYVMGFKGHGSANSTFQPWDAGSTCINCGNIPGAELHPLGPKGLNQADLDLTIAITDVAQAIYAVPQVDMWNQPEPPLTHLLQAANLLMKSILQSFSSASYTIYGSASPTGVWFVVPGLEFFSTASERDKFINVIASRYLLMSLDPVEAVAACSGAMAKMTTPGVKSTLGSLMQTFLTRGLH